MAVFFKALRSWITEGDIIIQDEFFIVKNPLLDNDSEMWTSKFQLDMDALPSFVNKDTANNVRSFLQ